MNDQSESDLDPTGALATELDDVFGEDQGPPKVVFLVGLSGKHAGKLFRVPMGDSVLGRSSKALVVLEEPAVSHRHARLQVSNQSCVLEDLGSTNGTFLNDKRLGRPETLNAGDVIRLGTSTLGYLTDAEDDEDHTRALAKITHPTFGDGGSSGLATQGPRLVVRSQHGPIAGGLLDTRTQGNPLDDVLDKLELATEFLKQYWKLIVIAAAAGAVAGALSPAIKPPLAKAEFEILLRDEKAQGSTNYFATQSVDYFAAAERNFSNHALVGQTLKNMGLPINANIVSGTALGLSFQKEGLNVYRGSYQDPSSEFAEKFLAQHLQNYLEHEIGKSIRVLKSEVELLTTQYHDNEALLDQYEKTLREFKEKHLSNLPETSLGQLSTRSGLLERKDFLSATLGRAQEELRRARVDLDSGDAAHRERVVKSAPYENALVVLKQKLATAQAQGLTESHPDMVKLRAEQQSLEKLRDDVLNAATTDSERRANLEYLRLRQEVSQQEVIVASTDQELTQVNARLGEIEKISGLLPKVEEKLSGMTRAVEDGKRTHDRLYEQLKTKELALQLERANVAGRYEVIQRPHAFRLEPTKTRIKRGAMGAVAGILFGVILGILHWLKVYAAKRQRQRTSFVPQ